MQRTLPLYDAKAVPPNWNERMAGGEYAVLFHNAQPAHFTSPSCIVFSSLAEAEENARAETATHSKMRCAIYDHRGLAAAPVSVIAGVHGADKLFVSSRFLLGGGIPLTIIGVTLATMEWTHNFRLGWAGIIGFRLAPIGLVLIFIDLLMKLPARRKTA